MHELRTRTSTIALAPVGDAPVSPVEAVLPALRRAFGVDVVLAPAVALPKDAFSRARRQYNSTRILEALAVARKAEWERLLGVADVDLYVPDLNFVFGEADSQRGVAVFSLARLRSSDEALFRRRASTEAIHELGHTYGLSHCNDPHCVMWFSNTLAESDRKGTSFCPAHAEQLGRAQSAGSRGSP